MKRTFQLTLLLFFHFYCFSQEDRSPKMGQTTVEELELKTYKKDPGANALVLYEMGNLYTSMEKSHIHVVDFYHRVKILKKEGLDKGTIKIPYLSDEKISSVLAVSHYLKEDGTIEKQAISDSDVLRNKIDDDVSEVIINFPNAKVGSVLEYSYTLSSPYLFIKDWVFQSDIPKVRSEFAFQIPKNRDYIIRLRGLDTLTIKDTVRTNKCFNAARNYVRCKSYRYGIDSIKAFKEELYMTDPSNVISSLTFKLAVARNGQNFLIYKLPDSWKQFDLAFNSVFKKDQKSNARFYKRKLPDSILEIEDPLAKAKHIYHFIQNHYTWNRYLGGSITKKLRRKFKSKEGSVNLINSSLFNSLKSAGISCSYALVSTRGHGIPMKESPDISDFNYMIVKASINGKSYFLDATEKELSFGTLPKRVLNVEARVMDFEKGSYWEKVKPAGDSKKISILGLSFDEDMNLVGKMQIKRVGINAYNTRESYKQLGKVKYLEALQDIFPKVFIEEHSIQNLKDREKSVVEKLDVSIENEDINSEVFSDDIIKFSPVFFEQLSSNPFKSKERLYDLDFLYPRMNTYRLNIDIPEGYEVTKLPENAAFKLPNGGGSYIYRIGQDKNKINLYIRFSIKKDLFSTSEYFYLKQLYEEIIKAEESPIVLKKK